MSKPLNSKVIKGFAPELRSRYVFFVFQYSYVLCLYVMNFLCMFPIFMYGYVTERERERERERETRWKCGGIIASGRELKWKLSTEDGGNQNKIFWPMYIVRICKYTVFSSVVGLLEAHKIYWINTGAMSMTLIKHNYCPTTIYWLC